MEPQGRSGHSHITSQVFLLAQDRIVTFQLDFEGLDSGQPCLLVMCEAPGPETRMESNSSVREVGLREVNELSSCGVRKRIELECFHAGSDFVRRHGLPHSSAPDEAFAPFVLTLRSAGSGNSGVPCPAHFCAT